MTLNLAFCFALFLGLAVVTQAHAEDYYIYQTTKGVISNKEPPPGSKIIKRLPGVTDKESPQAQEPGKMQPKVQPEGSLKPSKTK